jgi:multisubunit Na+/H+ antiporter MnhE subunit
MGILLSVEFVIGMVVGAILMLLIQQMMQATRSMGQWLPVLVFLGLGVCAVVGYVWWMG